MRPCTRRGPRTSPSIKAFLKLEQSRSAARKRRRADKQNGHILTCILYHKNGIKSIENQQKLSTSNEQKCHDHTQNSAAKSTDAKKDPLLALLF